MEGLGLNDHHRLQIISFLRFVRYQRAQRIHAIDACFTDLKESRLIVDTTFTKDEIEDMLDGLLAVVRGEAEAEFINSSHINALLLRQMFTQAEQWHLKLAADISELENRELLAAIKSFEDEEFSLKKDKKPIVKLEQIDHSGAAPLLQAEIGRLAQENDRLRDNLKCTESQAIKFVEEKNKLSKQLSEAQANLDANDEPKDVVSASADVTMLQAQMGALKNTMENDLENSHRAHESLNKDLTGAKHRLLEVQEQLELAEKELEKKFSQTNVYQNMKRMLDKKNELIKKLRSRLSEYEPDEDSD